MARSAQVLARWAAAASIFLALPAQAVTLEEHIKLCDVCHGPNGNSVIPAHPKLAGLDPNYLQRQLLHYKTGQRKNPVMNQIVLTVEDAAVVDLANHYGEQKRSPGQATEPAVVPRGRQLFEEGNASTKVPACASCHGSDGLGDSKYPRLAAQQSAYVEAQLRAFKSGERANDPKGAMGEVARLLSDADMLSVSQFIATLKEE